jgi:hypothetical protein
VGTVPEPRFEAFKAVRLTPLAAGSVAGKRASGTVPVVRFEAFNAVREAPEPEKVVAVTTPDTVTFPAFVTVTASLVVTPLLPTPRRTVPSGVLG